MATNLFVQNVANDIGASSLLNALTYSSYNLDVCSHINNLLASIGNHSTHINLDTVFNILELVPHNSEDIDNKLFITGTLSLLVYCFNNVISTLALLSVSHIW